ncbi:MAG: DUF3341 domain-containing protein [Candidatus Methylacidiphilales bacterium]|nr:DUF3341 domain-containing protein [Candidatus Methylacidiphilales bacterium]
MSNVDIAKIYGIGAEFKNPTALYEAAEKVRDRGFKFWDVYSPFPIHGMDGAMGLGKSWVSALSLIGGVTGFTTGLLLETITSVYVYPMVVQGKPFFSLPAFFPVMFELTILFTAFATVGGMFLINMLPRWHHPVFNWERFTKATDDGFFIVIETIDPRFDGPNTAAFLNSLGGTNITYISK